MTRNRVYLCVQTCLCVLTVAVLAFAAVRIYREGSARNAENPLEPVYTSEAVAGEYAGAAPLVFITIGMAAAGLILGVKDEKSGKPVRDPELERDLIEGRIPSLGEALRRERSTQKKVLLIGWGLFALCMVPILIYLSNQAHFPQRDLEGMIYALATGVFPWIGAGIACLMGAGILADRSVRREIAAAKEQAASLKKETGAKEQAASLEKETGTGSSMWAKRPGHEKLLQAGIAACAIVCIILGVMNGSMQDVLVKAAAICTECIGLG